MAESTVLPTDHVSAPMPPVQPTRAPAPRIWRHKKRGTVYTEVSRSELQVATRAPMEGDTIVTYRGEDGRMWSRLDVEFEDGRFEEVK